MTAQRATAWWRPHTVGSPAPGSMLVLTYPLALFGLVILASAAHAHHGLVARQAGWMVLGLAVALVLRRVSYQRWLDGALLVYGAALGLLVMALVIGRASHGATRWLALGPIAFQPSELAKLATILALARIVGDAVAGGRPLTGRTALLAALIAGVPAVLVFVQPDLGSASVFAWILLVVLWLAGLPRRYLVALAIGVAALLPIAWALLKEYQRTRLLVFMNPNLDPMGAGYTIIQSRIAIGSGGWWGKGWMAGTQNQLNFLPERQTDFIFSVIGEEWGFIGSAVLLWLFARWLGRGWRVAAMVREMPGRLLVGGLVAWLGYHIIINVGMTMGLLPVVGIPLPLMSYGGSAVLMALIAVGIIESVRLWSPRF